MSTAQEIWAKWDPAQHETEYAQKRIKSAQSAKLTPIKIDHEDMYGYFQGSSGRYETWLDQCPCVDFHRSKLPCKHIYRLAMELGVFDAPFQTNSSAIPTVRKEKHLLSDTIDLVEELPESAQRLLLEIVQTFAGNKSITIYWLPKNPDYDALLRSGLLVDATSVPPTRNFAFPNHPDLKKKLTELGLEFKKASRKDELRQFCIDNYADEIGKYYTELFPVAFSTAHAIRNVHFYLHRKYDYVSQSPEYIFGFQHEDDGSDIVAHRLLESELPDDAVTNELIKRGYYIRH